MRPCPLALIVLALLAAALAAACTGDLVPTLALEEPAAVPTLAPEKPTAVPTRHGDAVEPTREPTAALTPGSQTEAPPATAPPTPEATAGAGLAGAESLVARAQDDLARRLGLPSDAIRLVSLEAVEWPDAGLGCPQHRLLYPDVVTPGFRVLLEAEDQTYEYHTDKERLVILCDDGRPAYPVIPFDPGEIMDGKPWLPAD